MSPRPSQITESPIKAPPPFLELCCVIGDNGVSMNLHRRRREINGSSPSWRIKKKKKSYGTRAEVEIHESTYVVGVHFSQAPEAWTPANLRKVAARIPRAGQPPPPTARGAGGALSAEQGAARLPEDPRPGRARSGPAPPAPASTPERAKQTSGLARDQRAARGEKSRPPPAPTGARPLPQLHGQALGTQGAPKQSGSPGAGKPGRRPRRSAQPRERGRPRALASPPARQPHPRRRPPTTPAGAAVRGPTAGRPRSGPGMGTGTRTATGPHRNALEDAPGRGCPDVFGVAVADNGGLLAAAIAHQVIHVALPTGHLRALRTAAGTARSSRRSGGGSGRRRRRGGRRGGGGEEAALRRHRPPPSPRSCGGRTRGRR